MVTNCSEQLDVGMTQAKVIYLHSYCVDSLVTNCSEVSDVEMTQAKEHLPIQLL